MTMQRQKAEGGRRKDVNLDLLNLWQVIVGILLALGGWNVVVWLSGGGL